MAKFTDEERQRILKEFQRRRTLGLLISIPILAGTFALALLVRNPEYHIAGLRGLTLAIPAAVVLALGLVLHFRNWRCPACGRSLNGRASFCRGCGAVFTS